ncbi:chloramphenicol phosphotransferase-like protein [Kribbella rubisoli]|uniref:Chloramphenicol phosphotransferase-like protein n=1 Tax=Kribbella rubisoli TaxID=3075929 RepID=A0A4Q7XN88_9ACTN|nr:AAA family ATPase [Kribbella rubisoli]RZU24525.1 chloramphenicol phosphotransferase-like protein [Kribbella rubisoli]
MESKPKVVLVTGMQAAGKSTIAPLLAARMGPPAATLDGDVFYRGVVAGAEIMTPEPSPEAVRQLELRYDASALVAQHYADAGFDFVCSDIVLGEHVERWFSRLRGVDPYLVVLVPSVESIVEREIGRGGNNAYRDWGPSVEEGVRALMTSLDETPRRGLWLDTTGQTPAQTVDEIDLEKARW